MTRINLNNPLPLERPENPNDGDVFLDSEPGILYVYLGGHWRPASTPYFRNSSYSIENIEERVEANPMTTPDLEVVRLECTTGNSSKFWEIQVKIEDGKSYFRTVWGKIDGYARESYWKRVNPRLASGSGIKDYRMQSLIKAKEAGGYQKVLLKTPAPQRSKKEPTKAELLKKELIKRKKDPFYLF